VGSGREQLASRLGVINAEASHGARLKAVVLRGLRGVIVGRPPSAGRGSQPDLGSNRRPSSLSLLYEPIPRFEKPLDGETRHHEEWQVSSNDAIDRHSTARYCRLGLGFLARSGKTLRRDQIFKPQTV
jgi:hypothetical protein